MKTTVILLIMYAAVLIFLFTALEMAR